MIDDIKHDAEHRMQSALEALRAFVEGGSIAQAGERLGRTPPQVGRLLASLEEPMPMTKAQYVKRLLRYRARFAQIASAKYDEGLFDSEVNVLVVRISASDLN